MASIGALETHTNTGNTDCFLRGWGEVVFGDGPVLMKNTEACRVAAEALSLLSWSARDNVHIEFVAFSLDRDH